MRVSPGPLRIVRIIARLNVGGPAIQALTLTQRLTEHGYETTLVRGREDPDEGSMDYLASQLHVRPILVPWLRRDPGLHDIPALIALIRIMRQVRPQIVHTHAAKGGTLGRLAALIATLGHRPRPLLIHTYHGHSLTGYFSPRKGAVYRTIERVLGRCTDRLVAVSQQVRDDLVGMGVAPAAKFEVIPLGFDLRPFTAPEATRLEARRRVRCELGIAPEDWVVTLIARLVPIKRVDRFLRIVRALDDLEDVRFVIVGDGELREALKSSEDAVLLGEKLIWTGFRRDMPAVCFASDVVALTSDNEGTPVSLIEAQAAGVPVVATQVGGAASVVAEGETGFLVRCDDDAGFARILRQLYQRRDLAASLGRAGAVRATRLFGLDRLIGDILRLYRNGQSRHDG